MTLTSQIAKHFREVYFGENWTESDLRNQLADVTWEEAVAKVYSVNTIASLVYHINYFVSAVIKVLEGNSLYANDNFSFDHPPINSKEDWENLLSKTFSDGEKFAGLIEQLPESKMWEIFSEEKYGTYYRNIQGIIEHAYYHLGQIVVIKKILRADKK